MFIFLYPKSYLKHNQVDEAYITEAIALEKKGYTTISFDSETFLEDDFSKIAGKTVVYRGWMLTLEEYDALEKRLAEFDVKMHTSVKEYKSAHYLPEWSDLLKGLTPETHVFHNNVAAREYIAHHNKTFFVKDFVKSLKTETKSFISDVEGFDNWISEVDFYKGFIEGGICLREVESFKEETELRYFVFNGTIYSNNNEVPSIVVDVTNIIDLPFYSVDVVLDENDVWRVVEIGDGQVSSSETWDLELFSNIFEKLN